jgi:hypothetical protein
MILATIKNATLNPYSFKELKKMKTIKLMRRKRPITGINFLTRD